jgi:ribosome recycling factor
MERAVQHFVDQILAIRAGVVSPALIETIKVPHNGTRTPIRYLAQVSQSNTILVTPFDPSACGPIQKTLEAAGHSCYICRGVVVINLPRFSTSADKERATNQVRKLAEDAKVVLRNLRKKARQNLTGSEDEVRQANKKLQELTDLHVARVDTLADEKVKSL